MAPKKEVENITPIAIGNDVVESYNGFSSGSRRSFIDIESNISVRPGYNKNDYYSFRPNEAPPAKQKDKIRKCMEAYKHVGIVRTIIDLMSDFACQGIEMVHQSPSVDKFIKEWFIKVKGPERSERFLNALYKCGTAIMKRQYGSISVNDPELNRAKNKRIALSYAVLNPLVVEVKNPIMALYKGKYEYVIKTPSYFSNMSDGFIGTEYNQEGAHLLSQPTIELKQEDLSVYHYKKDDWELWGDPIIVPILDDLVMYEKMKLADMSALDGAISNIRLWTLGILDGPNSILPTKTSINKLRNVLAGNTGGGTIDLIWGPELKFQESATQVYKFLGTEKYGPVLNSLYAGLGVPPTMTGMADAGGGYTNNFVSLKTLLDRLQYGRELLMDFWTKELKLLSKEMGFRQIPTIRFDHMTLNDESAEKNLLIQLVDRNMISVETLQERFKEDPIIEKYRIERERKDRDNDKMPKQASPYHDPQMDEKADKEKEKIVLQNKNKPVSPNGRPKFAGDTKPRKKKRILPRGASAIFSWASKAQNMVAELITPALLSFYQKSNLRQLTTAEFDTVEKLKFAVLSHLSPEDDICEERLNAIISEFGGSIDAEIKEIFDDLVGENKLDIPAIRNTQLLALSEKWCIES